MEHFRGSRPTVPDKAKTCANTGDSVLAGFSALLLLLAYGIGKHFRRDIRQAHDNTLK